MPGTYFTPLHRVFLNLSGGTVTGDTVFTSDLTVSGNTIFSQGLEVYSIDTNIISASTFYSGGTILETVIIDIINNTAFNTATKVQPGSNIITGGTLLQPTISVVSSPSFDNFNSSGNSYFNSISGSSLTGTNIFIETDFIPTIDNNSSIGSPIKRFRDLYTVNGIAVNFTADTAVVNSVLRLGNTDVTETNIILSGHTLGGGNW